MRWSLLLAAPAHRDLLSDRPGGERGSESRDAIVAQEPRRAERRLGRHVRRHAGLRGGQPRQQPLRGARARRERRRRSSGGSGGAAAGTHDEVRLDVGRHQRMNFNSRDGRFDNPRRVTLNLKVADEIRYAACTLFLIYITIEIFAIIKLPMIFQDIILILGNKSVDDFRISADSTSFHSINQNICDNAALQKTIGRD